MPCLTQALLKGFAIGLCLAVLPVAGAQFINQSAPLFAPDEVGFARLGESAALSADGNTAILGGGNDNSYAGAAWIFARTNSDWSSPPVKLVGSGSSGMAEQGVSVAISADGNTAIVGGPFDNTVIGAAWVFIRTNGVWTQQGGKLVGSGATGISAQGSAVAISADGNTAAVGGPWDTGNTGAVWIFTRTNGVWTQQGAKLAGSVGPSMVGSALSISADGNTVVAGGPADNNNAGAVWIFARTGSTWSQQGSKLVGSGAALPAQQGTAVAMSADGNTLVSGGPADTAGAFWAFTRTGGVWSQQGGKLNGTSAIGAPAQGWLALSGDGNTVIVSTASFGPTWVFTRAGGVWTRQSNQTNGSIFARGAVIAISADGNTVLMAAPDDGFGSGDASVYVALPRPGGLSAIGVTPASGSGTTQTFSFTFSDTAGYQKLSVVDVLINNFLDGRQACYIAVVPSTATSWILALVDNEGDAGGPLIQIALPGTKIAQNSQCTITGAGSSVSGSGNTLTVTLAITFAPSFSGNKIIYAAARQDPGSSPWLAVGTWNVPGPTATGPAVSGMTPAFNNNATQTYTFTFTDTNGWQDIGVANILVNGSLDGRQACYLAVIPAAAGAAMLRLLVDSPTDAGGPFTSLAIPGSGTVSNSQCTVSAAGSSIAASGNILTVTLPITFSHSFTGNRVFYLAARNNTVNSGWQSVGTVAVP